MGWVGQRDVGGDVGRGVGGGVGGENLAENLVENLAKNGFGMWKGKCGVQRDVGGDVGGTKEVKFFNSIFEKCSKSRDDMEPKKNVAGGCGRGCG